jgi:RHS repeat-associated protein
MGLQDEFGLNWYDYGARFYDDKLPGFGQIDPRAEEYYSWSPYTYCGDNPIKRVDINGEGWGEFLQQLGKSFTAAITIGAQAGVEMKAAGRPALSLSINGGSKDLIGVREGGLTHIAQEDSPTRYGHSLGFSGFGTSTEAEITKTTEKGTETVFTSEGTTEIAAEYEVEKGTKTVTGSALGFGVASKETAEIRTNKRTGATETKTSDPESSTVNVDIGSKLDIKASAIIGIDISIDLGKIVKAFEEL